MMNRVTIRSVRREAPGMPRSAAMCVLLAVLLTGWCWCQSAAAGQKHKKGQRTAAEKSKAAAAESAQSAKTGKARAKAKGKRSRRGRAQRAGSLRLGVEYLRYMPDDCRAVGWADVEALRHSNAVKVMDLDVSDTIEQWEEIEAITGRPLGSLQRIVFGAVTSFEEEVVGIGVFCFKAPAGETRKNHDPDPGSSWRKEKVGRFTLFIKDDAEPWAICDVDADTMLAGNLEPLRAALKRDAPLELPEKLADAYSLLDPTKEIAFAMLLPKEWEYYSLTLQASLGIAAELVRGVEAVTLEFDLEDNLDVRFAAVCRDGEIANQLKGIATGLWALVQASNCGDADAKTRAILSSVEFPVRGRSVAFELSVPAAFLNEIGDDGNCSLSSLVSEDNGLPFGMRAPGLLAATPEPACYTGDVQYCPSGSPCPPPALTPVAPAASPPSPYGTCCPSSPAAPAVSTYPATPVSGYASSSPGYPASPAYGAPYSGTISPPRAPAPPPRPTLKLDDVARMAEAGVEEQVMLGFIQKHQLAAPLTADDLILLTEKKVGVNVILALQSLPAASPGDKPAPPEKKTGATTEPDANGARTVEQPTTATEPPSPGDRRSQLIWTSEELRELLDEWERTWCLDQPDGKTPYHTHGGLM